MLYNDTSNKTLDLMYFSNSEKKTITISYSSIKNIKYENKLRINTNKTSYSTEYEIVINYNENKKIIVTTQTDPKFFIEKLK